MLRYTIDTLDQEITYETCSIVALQAMLETAHEPGATPVPEDKGLWRDCQNCN